MKRAPYVTPVRFIGPDRIGGYAVRFGDTPQAAPTMGMFTTSTDFKLGQIGAHRPMLFQDPHAMAVKVNPAVGVWDVARVDNLGVWVEGQLKKAHAYREAIANMIASGALKLAATTTPGMIAKAVRLDGTVEITSWPLLGVALAPATVSPPLLSPPAFKALFTALALPVPPVLEPGSARARRLLADLDRLGAA